MAQADTLLAPDEFESTFHIGTDHYFKIEWIPVDTADSYLVSLYWSETESYEVIATTHTSIIRTKKPTHFSLSSINECGVKSTTSEPRLPKDTQLSHYSGTFFPERVSVPDALNLADVKTIASNLMSMLCKLP